MSWGRSAVGIFLELECPGRIGSGLRSGRWAGKKGGGNVVEWVRVPQTLVKNIEGNAAAPAPRE